MKTINDQVFGQMTYEYQWERQIEETLWGRSYNLSLIVESGSDDDESISKTQQDAFKDFTSRHAALAAEMMQHLVRYCQTDLGILGCTEEEFLSHNTPTSLFFPLSGEWVILFDSAYVKDAGLAVVVRGGQIEAGSQDIIL